MYSDEVEEFRVGHTNPGLNSLEKIFSKIKTYYNRKTEANLEVG